MSVLSIPAQDLRIRSIRPTAVERTTVLHRLRLTLIATVNVVLGVPALLLLILTIVGGLLVPIGVGVGLLGLVVPATARLTRLHRAISSALLGATIAAGYADTSQRRLLSTAWIWLRDPARWRDIAFCAFSATGGFALSLLVVSLLISPVVYLIGLLLDGGWTWLLLMFVSGLQVVAWWLLTPALVQARALAERGILDVNRTLQLERRVQDVTASRAETLDHSAAELRRIERDLHDGPQARIVALGMSLSRAEQLITHDPDAAEALLRQARGATADMLDELRSLVRDIHPPVLADRGLTGAIEALVLVVDTPVTLTAPLSGRPPPPVETAVYFAVAEGLANTAKHANATRSWVTLSHSEGVLRAVVGDDGRGGAIASGSGLSGVQRRLAAFDGTLTIDSPIGGPTILTIEVPCVLSSPRTTPFSEKDSSES